MPNDVRTALIGILSQGDDEHVMSRDEAEKFIRQMELNGRYQTETWS